MALRTGGVLVVWRLDRLRRSLPDLVKIIANLERQDIGFERLTEKFEAGSAWLMLRLATPVSRWLGETGVNIATRLMGLLLAAVAVEIFASGLLVLLPGLG
jgi:hypothetical protein